MRLKSTYEELYALQVLHYLLGLKLENWKTDDKPDLKNFSESWGIEVVQDLYPKEIESEKHLRSVWNLRYSEWPLNKKKILDKNKVKLNIHNDILNAGFLGETTNTPEHVIQTIKEKIDLLNRRQYDVFNRYDLYVQVKTTAIDGDHKSYVAQIIETVVNYQKETELKFKVLYLVHDHIICVCDLENRTFNHIAISLELRGRIAEIVNTKLKSSM